MSPGRFVKLLLGGVLLIVAIAALKVGCSFESAPVPPNEGDHPTYIGRCNIEGLQASLLSLRKFIGGISSDFVALVEDNDKLIVALSTIFIAIFTIILGIATWLLWRATKKLVHGAEDTAKRQLRAYLSCKGGEFINIDAAAFNANKMPQCDLIIINQGQTPAKNIKIHRRSWATVNPAFTENPDLFFVAPFEERVRESTVKFIAPNAEIPMSLKMSRKLEGTEFENFKVGGIIFRAAFHITYDDVFGDPHFYKFGRAATLSTVHGLVYTEQWDGHEGDEDSD